MRPIAKSLPKTPYLKSTIFERRMGKISYTKHSRSVFTLGTKFSGNTSGTTYLPVNTFGKSHNKWLWRQSQHFRRPLVILPSPTIPFSLTKPINYLLIAILAKHAMRNLKNCKYSNNWKQSSVRIIIVLLNKCIVIRRDSDTNSSFYSFTRFNMETSSIN